MVVCLPSRCPCATSVTGAHISAGYGWEGGDPYSMGYPASGDLTAGLDRRALVGMTTCDRRWTTEDVRTYPGTACSVIIR